MVVAVLVTVDRRIRVYIHSDHTAEITNGVGTLMGARLPLDKIGKRLADLGVASEELIEG